MYYEINVSKRTKTFPHGVHFFATAPRSLMTMKETRKAVEIFKMKFPESEGYKISVCRMETVGHEVNEAFDLNSNSDE